MKKNIALISLLFTAFIFSSCVVIDTKDPVVFIPTYSVTLVNKTSFCVRDWYVKNQYNTNFVLSDMEYPVPSGTSSTIGGLYTNKYYVYFKLDSTYYKSNPFILNKNIEYRLEERNIIITRSAAAEPEQKTKFVLIDSDGSEIPLTETTEE